MSDHRFKVGDRVKESDAYKEAAIPAHHSMQGTVVELNWTRVVVAWDIDQLAGVQLTPQMPEDIVLIEE